MTRERSLFTTWQEGQGAKIKAARTLAAYGACASMARRLATTLPAEYTRLLLTLDQIEECEMRAVTSARNVRFGAPPATEEEWRLQLTQTRVDLAEATEKARTRYTITEDTR